MKTIALMSQKGGSGKTTLAVHLAVCAVQDKRSVALIDIDPQGSAADWYEARGSEGELAGIHATPEALPSLLTRAAEGGADLAILDTAPHSNKAAAIAAKLADFVLVPCRPSRFDLKALGPTFDVLRLTATPAAIVMNVCPRGRMAEETAELLREQGFPVLDVMVSSRVAFSHAVVDGRAVHEYEPEGKAAEEVSALYQIVRERIDL